MKIVEGSCKGRGGTGRFRGGGLGDRRFASRFTDPRFQLSARLHSQRRQQQSAQEQLIHSVTSDTRFAQRVDGTTAAAVVGISKQSTKPARPHHGQAGAKEDAHHRSGSKAYRRDGTDEAAGNARTHGQNKQRNAHLRAGRDRGNRDDCDTNGQDACNDFDDARSEDSFVAEYEKLSSGSDNEVDQDSDSEEELNSPTGSTMHAAGQHGSDEEDAVVWDDAGVGMCEPQRRLAVVNCDWDHIRAVDLFAVLHYALPLGGELHEVCVYLSELGKKMLEYERVHGPDLWSNGSRQAEAEAQAEAEEDAPHSDSAMSSVVHATNDMKNDMKPSRSTTTDSRPNNIVNDSGRKSNTSKTNGASLPEVQPIGDDECSDVESGFSGSEVGSDGWVEDDPSMLQQPRHGEDNSNPEGEFFSAGKYRAYEMRRMQYYYAIARFDSADTAAAVYTALDGMDIEASGVVLDLRYVGDAEVFDEAAVANRATRIPPQFRPLRAFRAAALTQSRFRISWDQDSAFRHYTVQDSFTGTTTEDDLAAYLAPPPSDDDDEDEARPNDGNDNNKNTNHNEKQVDATLQKKRAKCAGSASAAAEKMRIRRKYAALLAEIGDRSDVDEDDAGSAHKSRRRPAAVDAESESGSEDDALNRFSDVELSSSASSDSGEKNGDAMSNMTEDEEEEGGLRGMEATLDLDATGKAVELQREARLRHRARDGNLAAKAELKYKLRRQALKRSKKETMIRERAEAQERRVAHLRADAAQLRALLQREDTKEGAGENQVDSGIRWDATSTPRTKAMYTTEQNEQRWQAEHGGDAVAANSHGASCTDTPVEMGGKERRKAHARKVKEQMAAARVAKRQMRRVTHQLGHLDTAVTPTRERQVKQDAEQAMHDLDKRFQHKLVSDPRYQLEVGQKDRRVDREVVQLAQTIARARRGRDVTKTASAGGRGQQESAQTSKSPGGEDMGSMMNYFLHQSTSK